LVYIKKLEIYGFKSFGFKNTVLHFDNGLVAVTGPNGSGKSNILDAIIFVLGENSPRVLRVDKFQSLFHDSQNTAHRVIRVSVVFDNSDRGIPVDSDTVTMSREMEGQAGESQYYLNGKKVSKMTILELLEIVVAAPNKLNIVQQGMITRISELNSEERRRIIEDLVGLSYFDEKKTEALNQLSESDRRLEVAMARMGEIRKRIDDLEQERNDQLRYQFIESEVKRFKAILFSNKIKRLRNEISIRNEMLGKGSSRLEDLATQISQLQDTINSIDKEKTEFMQEVDRSNKAKAQIDSKITSIVYDLERTRAVIKESDKRLNDIAERIPSIGEQTNDLNSQIAVSGALVNEKKSTVEKRRERMEDLKAQLEEINTKLEEVSTIISKKEKIKSQILSRKEKLSLVDGSLRISLARLEEKLETLQQKEQIDQTSLAQLKEELVRDKARYDEVMLKSEESKRQLNYQEELLVHARDAGNKIREKLRACSGILTRAHDLSSNYQSRIALADDLMNEDVALGKLIDRQNEFGIIGLVKDLLEWDQIYQKPAFAAASEWMKACVVGKVNDMIKLASYLKLNNLPRLRIIPLELVLRSKKMKLVKKDSDIIGILGDFIHSHYVKKLPNYLFGDVILVRNASAAFKLSNEGFRVVTIDGELFESNAKSMSIDYGSKIPDLSLDILLSEHITSLTKSSNALDAILKSKEEELNEIYKTVERTQTNLRILSTTVTETSIQKEHLEQSILLNSKTIEEVEAGIVSNSGNIADISAQVNELERRIDLIKNSLDRYYNRLAIDAEDPAHVEYAKLNSNKNELLKLIEALEIENRENVTSFVSTENEFNILTEKKRELLAENERLKAESEENRRDIDDQTGRASQLERELIDLREEEQRTIKTAGDSYSILQDYDRKLKALSEQERQFSREFNGLEKESVALKKDIANFSSQESQTYNDLIWLGYKELVDSEAFEVENLIKELNMELESIRSTLNMSADESYVQVTEGYRGMSARKNELESERNSIVLFIEEIIKEKRTVFMEAFQKVDEDIRKTFSDVSGANAYLQLENPDDVFSGGIMYLVQFPGKPARESTALSGGEKTMAATIFLLALQSLKPSPFYLMDEVDAHLDAQNTDRLSKILFERSHGNQIIMVTLKESTVAKADQIYGVYPKSGVSQIVYYKNPSHVPLAEIQVSDRS
jgi:chromosome segregation protein